MTERSAARLRIIAYSDYVCPWCYIGLRRIDDLQREFPVDVEWRPFELHPNTPTTGRSWVGGPGSESRVRAYTGNIIELARESDIPMQMPRIIANSHKALEAAEFAREHGAAGGYHAMHHALFEAYFAHERDIGDVEVLCDVARSCGVDAEGLLEALADGRYAQVVDETTTAARNDEIFSAPTYIFTGGFRLTGAQDYPVFQNVTRRLLDRIASGAIAAD